MASFADQRTARAWGLLRGRLEWVLGMDPDAVLASSMGVEDMLLLHALAGTTLHPAVLMLDTGRLHPETLRMVEVIRDRYGVTVEVWRPDSTEVEAHVAEHGEFAFYESLALRKACCHIRKVEPLGRALAGHSAWITGQRRKFNPLAAWTSEQVWALVRALDIPYNPLHDHGYPSIGCEPCTRAVRPGEDPRAGRWWWEQRDNLECGLHAGNLNGTHPTVVPRDVVNQRG